MAKLYGLDELKRRRDQKEHLKEVEALLKKSGAQETSNITVTDRGAFRKKPEVANDIVKADIFKLTLVQQFSAVPKILVTNKEGSWEGEFPWGQEWAQLFDGKTERYVVATPNSSGKLHIECIIEPHKQHRF